MMSFETPFDTQQKIISEPDFSSFLFKRLFFSNQSCDVISSHPQGDAAPSPCSPTTEKSSYEFSRSIFICVRDSDSVLILTHILNKSTIL